MYNRLVYRGNTMNESIATQVKVHYSLKFTIGC